MLRGYYILVSSTVYVHIIHDLVILFCKALLFKAYLLVQEYIYTYFEHKSFFLTICVVSIFLFFNNL